MQSCFKKGKQYTKLHNHLVFDNEEDFEYSKFSTIKLFLFVLSKVVAFRGMSMMFDKQDLLISITISPHVDNMKYSTFYLNPPVLV